MKYILTVLTPLITYVILDVLNLYDYSIFEGNVFSKLNLNVLIYHKGKN